MADKRDRSTTADTARGKAGGVMPTLSATEHWREADRRDGTPDWEDGEEALGIFGEQHATLSADPAPLPAPAPGPEPAGVAEMPLSNLDPVPPTVADETDDDGGLLEPIGRLVPPGETVNLCIFGDLHSAYFFNEPYFPDRLALPKPLPFKVEGRCMFNAALLEGSLEVDQTDIFSVIAPLLPQTERLCLAFGQVDLELGFYRQRLVDRVMADPVEIVEDCLTAYADLLDGLDLRGIDVMLKGVNLTAVAPPTAAALFLGRRLGGQPNLSPQKARRELFPLMLDEAAQNAMHLRFNDGLRALAKDRGFGYFDIVAQLMQPAPGVAPRHPDRPQLADRFKSGGFDHRLADTVVCRRLHYMAAARAFGLAR